MNKATRFSLITLWIVASRGYDAISTYQYTPDLEQEANPLVSILGMGWTPLLSIIGVLMIGTIYAYYQHSFHPIDLKPQEPDYSFEEFSTFLYFGRKESWLSMFYKAPASLKRFTHYMGYFFTRCLSYAGIVSTIMWLLLNYSEAYRAVHSTTLIYLLLVIGGSSIIYYGNRKLYKTYKAAM